MLEEAPALAAAHSAFFCFRLLCDKGYGCRGNGLGHRLVLQAGVKPGAEQQERDKGNALHHNSSRCNRVGRTEPLGGGCWEILTEKPLRILTEAAMSENKLACVEEGNKQGGEQMEQEAE